MIALSLWGALSHAGTTKDGRAAIGSAASAMAGPSAPVITREVDPKEMPSTSMGTGGMVALRAIPTVSTQVAVGRTTFIPYLAAGFGGGYATEFDRSLHTLPVASSGPSLATTGLKSLLGPHLIPNEVHLGIRFPF